MKKALKYAKKNPNETKWSIVGIAVGMLAGLFIGGVGIATMGGAFGIPAALILAFVGGMIGNRYGVGKDRPSKLDE